MFGGPKLCMLVESIMGNIRVKLFAQMAQVECRLKKTFKGVLIF